MPDPAHGDGLVDLPLRHRDQFGRIRSRQNFPQGPAGKVETKEGDLAAPVVQQFSPQPILAFPDFLMGESLGKRRAVGWGNNHGAGFVFLRDVLGRGGKWAKSRKQRRNEASRERGECLPGLVHISSRVSIPRISSPVSRKSLVRAQSMRRSPCSRGSPTMTLSWL